MQIDSNGDNLHEIPNLAFWEFFSYFSLKTRFDISCKLSPLETICMKCQIFFSGKNKKNILTCLFKILPRVPGTEKSYLELWKQNNGSIYTCNKNWAIIANQVPYIPQSEKTYLLIVCPKNSNQRAHPCSLISLSREVRKRTFSTQLFKASLV